MLMKKLIDNWKLIENSESPILIVEEMGKEKDEIAAIIHYNDNIRKDKAFAIQICSEFSDKNMKEELFGSERGSLTDAVCDKKGLFEIVDGGTLFLDEIGDLSIDIQRDLLNVLKTGMFQRVGGNEQKKVDIRLVASTKKDLSKMANEGLFLEDLLSRFITL